MDDDLEQDHRDAMHQDNYQSSGAEDDMSEWEPLKQMLTPQRRILVDVDEDVAAESSSRQSIWSDPKCFSERRTKWQIL